MGAAAIGVGLGATAIQGYLANRAANKQAAAAKEASEAQLAAIQQGGEDAAVTLSSGAPSGLHTLGLGADLAEHRLGQLAEQQAGLGVDRLNEFDSQLSQLQGRDFLSNESLQQNFQADPGFQFRQQQGEEAINRAAAASGGRLSGRTLKALAGFNQNLASNEFQNFANREAQRQGFANQVGQFGAGANLGLAQFGLGGGFGTQSQLAQLPFNVGQIGLNTQQGVSNQIAGAALGQVAPTNAALAAPVQFAGSGDAAIANAVGSGASNALTLAALYGTPSTPVRPVQGSGPGGANAGLVV